MRRISTVILCVGLGVVFFGCQRGRTKVGQELTAPPAPVVSEPTPPSPKPVTPEPKPQPPRPVEDLTFENVYFDFDRYDLKPDARDILTRHAQKLLAHPKIQILVEGHCDERGTIEYNLALGQKRADMVRDFLIRLGVAPQRISTISYGKERPLDPRSTEEAWAKNRRASFVIIP